jgi:hypothetical protein
MARKKPKAAAAQAWGPGKPLVAQIRGSAVWKEWVERLAKENRQSVAGMIDLALAHYARAHGFSEPPDR